MEKKGKSLENIIALIQETLKDSLNTQVFKNYKIENIGGRDREIDVLIESNINGFDMKIAIECKDYKTRVSVEKIEAFESKCKRIKGINKKVFISSKGFQLDAINAAKDFDIELQIASNLSSDFIANWFPITNLSFKVSDGGNSVLIMDLEDVDKLNSEFEKQIEKSELIITFNNGENNTIKNVITNIIKINENYIHNVALLKWMKLDAAKKNKSFLIPLIIRFHENCFLNLSGVKIGLTGIEINIEGLFEESPVHIKEIRRLVNIEGELKAETLTIQSSADITTSFVKTPDNNTTIHVSKNNEHSTKLKLLAVYDPKTNKLDITK